MGDDIFGLATSLRDARACRAWDRMQLAFLAHASATPGHLGEVLEREPHFAMGHAVKGLFYLMLGRRELHATAEEAHAAARGSAAQGGALPRERRYLDALAAWLDGRPAGAADIMAAVIADHPRDALAMKIDHAIRFILGDAVGMRRSIEAVLPAYDADHPALGYAMGCHAFALEETGAYAQARHAGLRALDLAADDAWGLHAVAHVHDMTAQARAGLDFLQGREAAWAHCNNFRYHVWWHKALMHLDLGETGAVLALYDDEIRADRTDDYRDISNAASLLCRLELDGVAIGDRWEELAELSAARTEDGCLIFADLHYLLALSGGSREAAERRLIARIRRAAAAGGGDVAERMARPGVAVAEGLAAFGDGDYARAFFRLRQARPDMARAGGSHAQRDVFERLTIDAAIRAGYWAEALALIGDRQVKRGGREDGYAAARRRMIADFDRPDRPDLAGGLSPVAGEGLAAAAATR